MYDLLQEVSVCLSFMFRARNAHTTLASTTDQCGARSGSLQLIYNYTSKLFTRKQEVGRGIICIYFN